MNPSLPIHVGSSLRLLVNLDSNCAQALDVGRKIVCLHAKMLETARVPAGVRVLAFAVRDQLNIYAVLYSYIVQPRLAVVVVLNADELEAQLVAIEIKRCLQVLAAALFKFRLCRGSPLSL